VGKVCDRLGNLARKVNVLFSYIFTLPWVFVCFKLTMEVKYLGICSGLGAINVSYQIEIGVIYFKVVGKRNTQFKMGDFAILTPPQHYSDEPTRGLRTAVL